MRHFALTTLIATTLAAPAFAAPAQYELDPTHTAVMFSVDHIGYAGTIGIFGEVSGTFTYDMDTQELSDVAVSISSASVNTFLEPRDAHVKKADFLDVEVHPEITFVAASGTPTSDTTGTVTGELTILGQSQPVTLDVTLNKAAAYPFGHKRMVLGLSLTGEIQRSAFGMTYGVDNGLVGDDVEIRVETEAMQMDG